MQLERAASTGTVCVIGLGKVGLTALCLLRKVAPLAKIIAIEKDDAHLEIARTLKKADVVEQLYQLPLLDIFTGLIGFIVFVEMLETQLRYCLLCVSLTKAEPMLFFTVHELWASNLLRFSRPRRYNACRYSRESEY